MKSGGFVQETTLLTGIIELRKQRLYGLGALVFLTCALIPLGQLAGLLYVLVPLRLHVAAPESIPVFRTINHLNSWAMMEVFVVGILVALVKLGAVANIEAGPAAVFFATVVVLTMLAAESFDPRLIWDVIEEDS
jgi:paraquat-inducible protein A